MWIIIILKLFNADLYTGTPFDIHNPLTSPLMAQPSVKHPRTHVTVAACDLLRNQGLAYAQLLRMAAVEVEEEILPGVPHGFNLAMNADVPKRWLENQVGVYAKAFEEEVA